MKNSIAFFGLGYVGLSTAICLASKEFRVCGFDIDHNKVKMINSGQAPFHEPGLDEILKIVISNGALKATTDYLEPVLKSDITFISVDTPSNPDGSADLSNVKKASEMIVNALSQKDDWHLIVVKSTVPPGTTRAQ
jgi:nucleotide sugar dehydrogenase